MERRQHRTMDREQQRAAGAAARRRFQADGRAPRPDGSDGALPGGRGAHQSPLREPYDSSRQPSATPLVGRQRVAASQGQGGPRTVNLSEASDPNRYRRMRRERSGERLEQARTAAPGVWRPDARRVRPARRAPSGRTVRRVALGALAALVAALVLFTVNISGRLNDGISADTRGALTPALPGQPFYMLLVGSDKSAEREADGSTSGTYRTDSIMLTRVDPVGAKVTLVSIQRDTLVDLGGSYGKQKINAAYTLGGPPLLVEQVAKLAGVPIAHYAELDFDSFTSVVDAIGGIDVNIPMDLDDDLANLHVKAGQQTIDGPTALALCRARHAYDKYGSGDYFRTANQRMVLGAILKKGLSGNPLTLLATINSAADSVTTDLTGLDLLLLGTRFLGFDASKDLYSGLEPTTSKYVGGVWYELLDETKWQAMMSRVDQGLPPYESDADNPTAGIAG